MPEIGAAFWEEMRCLAILGALSDVEIGILCKFATFREGVAERKCREAACRFVKPKSVIRLWGDCPLVSCSMLLA